MSSTPETVAESLVKESQQKRQRIATSLWPRARLLGEILYHQIDRDRLFSQASALTYKTLFSLLPVFVLSLLVLSTISSTQGENALDTVVKNTLFQQIGIDRFTLKDATGNDLMVDGKPVTPVPFIEGVIEQAKKSVSSKATGLIAFAILLYGAISLMIVIESTFNQIYGAVRPRSWPRRIMLYWCVLTLGPIGLAASIALGNSAYAAATAVASGGMVVSVLNLLSGFMVSWVLILLLYRVIPDTRVNWRPAMVGSFIAALAWEIGKWAFGIYVQRAARTSWYGSLALLPLFMFWIYITWSVALVGLEITYIQQYWPLLKRQFFFARWTTGGGIGSAGVTTMSDLRWVLSIGVLLFRRFKDGKPTAVHEAAELLMLPADVTGMLLDGLAKAGLVHEVRQGYALARPPETITAYDLLTAARALCQVPPELAREGKHVHSYPESAAVRELEDLETAWARSHALPALAGE